MTVTVYETDLGVYLNKNGGFKNLEWKSGKEMVAPKRKSLNFSGATLMQYLGLSSNNLEVLLVLARVCQFD